MSEHPIQLTINRLKDLDKHGEVIPQGRLLLLVESLFKYVYPLAGELAKLDSRVRKVEKTKPTYTPPRG